MRPVRRSAGFALAALVLAVAAVPAGASTSATRPAGSPDLAAMALALHDLPAGAELDREGYYSDSDFVASYLREFSLGGLRIGRSRLLAVTHDLGVEPTAADAVATFRELRGLLRTRAFRRELARALAAEAGVSPSAVTVTRPRTARIGEGAVSIAVGLKAGRTSFQASLTFVRVDRVLTVLSLVGSPTRKLYGADADRLARVAVERMRGGLVPTAVTPPVISGVLQPGQALTATRGTWTGDQLTFMHQWQRCSVTEPEIGCVDLSGAVSATYVVALGDLASRVRVVVTAANRLDAAPTTSSTTEAIGGPPGAPIPTTPPALDGLPQIGSALAADPGVWTGSPTEFAYQWRRCHPATDGCVDVAGATEPTYAIAPADAGSRLRVLVIATNESGPGGALSSPSATVP
jgi:hypothetical protein